VIGMLKHIQLGINEKFYFNYNGEQLPLRPISSMELDQCFFNALTYIEDEIANLVIKIKLRLLDPKTKIEIDNKKLAQVLNYYNNVNYWIVYFSMQDFQDDEFSKIINEIPEGFQIIKKMRNIHKIAQEVLRYSYQPEDVIQEIIKTREGKIVASIVFNLNVPLNELSKLTDLQKDFLILSRLEETKPVKHIISKTGDKVSVEDVLKGLV